MIYHSWLGHAFHLSPPRTLHTTLHLLSTSLTKALAFSAAKERANSAPVFIGLLDGCHTHFPAASVCVQYAFLAVFINTIPLRHLSVAY